MTVLKKILQESKDKKSLIGIRIVNEDGRFYCGYILDFNETLIQIQHYSESGQYDGVIIEKIENIESIDSEDEYSAAFQYLIERQNKFTNKTNKIELPNSDCWQFDFLRDYKLTNQILSFDFDMDYTIYGKIVDLDSEFVKLETIERLGELDGFSSYRLNDIKAISIDNIESMKRKALLEWNEKQK
ncbi:MAG: hypothetical protein JXR53_13135 [Bacteroidales bacterium]|nr:hypothetical protein [Bacteroidales bacterium]